MISVNHDHHKNQRSHSTDRFISTFHRKTISNFRKAKQFRAKLQCMYFNQFLKLDLIKNRKAFFAEYHSCPVIFNAIAPKCYYPDHTTSYTFKTVFDKCEYYKIAGNILKVTPGKYLFINKAQPYSSWIDEDGVRSFSINFPAPLVEDVLKSLKNIEPGVIDLHLSEHGYFFEQLFPTNDCIEKLLMQLKNKLETEEYDDRWVVRYLRRLISLVILSQYDEVKEIASRLRFSRKSTQLEIIKRLYITKDYIQSNPGEMIRLKKLAGMAFMSEGHFLRLFKKAFKKTPHQYIMEVRLNYAYNLIQSQNHIISEVVEKAGYVDASSFSRQFKSFFGRSPSKIAASGELSI